MWLIPSRRRLTKLRNFCDSAMAAETTTPALIIVDKQDYKDNEEAYLKLETHHFPNAEWKIHVSEAVGMGPKVREVWGIVKDRKWVGVLNDDHHIITKHWDVKLISQLNGKNFLTCNDGWNAPKRAAGATVFSMPLMEAFGFPMFPPQIDHLGIDDVFEQLGRACGCWEIDMSVKVEHHHAFKNPDMIDDTHRAVYGTLPWGQSPESKHTQEAFNEWFTKDFPGIVARVKEFRKSEQLAEMPRKDGSFGTPTISISE